MPPGRWHPGAPGRLAGARPAAPQTAGPLVTRTTVYVAGYSAFRIFEESVRIDSSEHFLGLRLNMYIAIDMTLAGLVWFAIAQRRPGRAIVIRALHPSTAGVSPAAGEDD
jgi:hypothetical protein